MHICGFGYAVFIFESSFESDNPTDIEVVASCCEEPFPEFVFVIFDAMPLKDVFGNDGATTATVTQTPFFEKYPMGEVRVFI